MKCISWEYFCQVEEERRMLCEKEEAASREVIAAIQRAEAEDKERSRLERERLARSDEAFAKELDRVIKEVSSDHKYVLRVT